MRKTSQIFKLLDRFLAPALKAADADPGRLYRGRVAVGFSFFLCFLALLRLLQYPWLSTPSLLFLLLLAISSLALFALKIMERNEAVAVVLILSCISIGAAFAVSGHSIYTHYFNWLPLAIVLGSFLCGLRWGAFFTCVAIVEVLCVLEMNRAYGAKVSLFETPESFVQGWRIHFIAVELVGTSLIYILAMVRSNSEKELGARRMMRAKTTRKAALAEVVGSLAHELNNPLAIIHGSMMRYRNEVGKGTLDPALRHYLWDCIADAQQRIESVASGLKTFAGGDVNEPMREISFQKLYMAAERQIREKARSRAVTLHYEEALAHQNLICRPQQITFVLASLLDNACDALKDKAGPADVRVRLLLVRKLIRIEIIDNGHRLSNDLADRLFQPFAVDDAGLAMSMALSVCRGIIGEHGGRIGFDRLAAGNCFWFELPIVEDSP